MLGVKDLSTLTDEQKDMVKSNMLKSFGLEDGNTDGFEIDVKIEDKMIVILKADLKKADSKILSKVGMNFTGADMSLKKAVEDMEDTGATCK